MLGQLHYSLEQPQQTPTVGPALEQPQAGPGDVLDVVGGVQGVRAQVVKVVSRVTVLVNQFLRVLHRTMNWGIFYSTSFTSTAGPQGL